MPENYTNDYMIAAHHRDNQSAVRVGPWPDSTGWSNLYEYTSGFCFTYWAPTNRDEHGQALLNEAASLMFVGVDPK